MQPRFHCWRRSGFVAAIMAAVCTTAFAARTLPATPDEVLGPLFVDVQRAHVFPDQKTFCDAVPKAEPAAIVQEYLVRKETPGFALAEFVAQRFLIPESRGVTVPAELTIAAHLRTLWRLLQRAPDQAVRGSSLLPLPHPYVVPGGRFREIYYWDSYFTMLGLRASGREDLVESMVDNFAYELAQYGLIPNGNRSYYLSRSQPPFFALMVEFVAQVEGERAYRTYKDALAAEYAYWMDRSMPTEHVVGLGDGVLMNRCWDRRDTPRQEAFAADEDVARAARAPARVFRDLRSAAESGWDFSSRWLGDGRTLPTIETTNVIPVDLNCLLWQLETTLAKAYALSGERGRAAELRAAAARRARGIATLCWSDKDAWFCDYDVQRQRRRENLTLAGMVPLFLRLASAHQAVAAAHTLETRFLRPGGVVTTLVHTGQQWDAPNGWAPLQWMTVRGLGNYGETALAQEIARRWLALNRTVYARTGKMMEKYNVEDLSLLAGGGEYPSQDGFGWTNGVYLALAADTWR